MGARLKQHYQKTVVPALVKEFAEELKAWPTAKGTIRFPVDKPLPAALVKKMVKARVAQNESKKAR